MAIPSISPYSMPMASDLPKNRVSWKANPKRSVLLIHDMQQYFLNAYTLGASPMIELIENIKLLKKQCEELGIPIVYTAQPGDQDPKDRALLTDFWGTGLADDLTETKIVDQLAPNPKDIVLTKWRYSAFKRTKLMEIMKENGRDQLIICGIYAHIGCLLTAADAFMQDIETFFACDAVADFSLEDHKMAMKYVAANCAVTTTTKTLLNEMKSINSPNEVCEDAKPKGLTLELIRLQVAKLLGESSLDIDDNEDLIDSGLDSIRIMSLVESWRNAGADVTFAKLASAPTISDWWNLLSSSK